MLHIFTTVQTNPERRDKMERFKGEGENATRSTGFLTTVEISACPSSFLLTHALITCGTGPASGLRSEQGRNIHVEELMQVGKTPTGRLNTHPPLPGVSSPSPPALALLPAPGPHVAHGLQGQPGADREGERARHSCPIPFPIIHRKRKHSSLSFPL